MANVFIRYWQWHYGEQLRLIAGAIFNILRYNFNYFSVLLLLKTLFSPWRRYRMSYGRGFDFNRYFQAFTFNAISRGLGAIMRTVLILLGLATEAVLLLGGAITLLIWLTLPLILVLGLFFGLRQIVL